MLLGHSLPWTSNPVCFLITWHPCLSMTNARRSAVSWVFTSIKHTRVCLPFLSQQHIGSNHASIAACVLCLPGPLVLEGSPMHLSWLVQVDTGAHGRRSHQAGVSKSWSCRDCGASVVMHGCLLHQQLRKTYQETAQSGKHQKSMLSRIVWTSWHHAQKLSHYVAGASRKSSYGYCATPRLRAQTLWARRL